MNRTTEVQIALRNANWITKMRIGIRDANWITGCKLDYGVRIGLRIMQIGLRKCKLGYKFKMQVLLYVKIRYVERKVDYGNANWVTGLNANWITCLKCKLDYGNANWVTWGVGGCKLGYEEY